jgi:hypothetical protein
VDRGGGLVALSTSVRSSEGTGSQTVPDGHGEGGRCIRRVGQHAAHVDLAKEVRVVACLVLRSAEEVSVPKQGQITWVQLDQCAEPRNPSAFALGPKVLECRVVGGVHRLR